MVRVLGLAQFEIPGGTTWKKKVTRNRKLGLNWDEGNEARPSRSAKVEGFVGTKRKKKKKGSEVSSCVKKGKKQIIVGRRVSTEKFLHQKSAEKDLS